MKYNEKKPINKSKVILTALMLIFLVGGNASAILGKKLKEKASAAGKSIKTGAQSIKAGDSRLHIAVRNGNIEGIKEICSGCGNDSKVINKQNSNGKTPLELAILWLPNQAGTMLINGKSVKYYKDPENIKSRMINYLINDAKSDVNAIDKNGTSPLHHAIQNKINACSDDKYIIWLIKAGADINNIDPQTGKSILDTISSLKGNFENYMLTMLLLSLGANEKNANLKNYNSFFENSSLKDASATQGKINTEILNDYISKKTNEKISLENIVNARSILL